MKKVISIAMITALFAWTAHATTATEDFESLSVGGLSGQGSAGGGWAAGWVNVAGVNEMVVDGTKSAFSQTGSYPVSNRRLFASPMSITGGAPDIWLSFDMKIDFDANIGNSFDVLNLMGTPSDGGGYGRENDPGGNTKYSALVSTCCGFYDFSTTDIPDDVWSTVAVKLEPTGSGTASYTMWVDPDFGLPEGAQAPAVLTGTMSRGGTSITGIELLTSYHTSTQHTSNWDNIRVSDEASPFVPEPGTFVLLAMGGLGLTLRRRIRA